MIKGKHLREKIDVLGVEVDRVDYIEAMEIFSDLMNQPGCSLIATPNSEIIVNVNKEPELKAIFSAASLVVPDGIGIVYASKLMGQPLSERVTGIDFFGKILTYLEVNEKSIYFFGSKSEILDLAIENIFIKHPKLVIAGKHHGYYTKDEEASIVDDINNSGAEFLCVALGSPKQEKFIYDNLSTLKPKAAIGVGGSLDVFSGALKRAPEFYRNNGLEWLYRLAQQPSRYKRIVALPIFMGKVLIKRIKK